MTQQMIVRLYNNKSWEIYDYCTRQKCVVKIKWEYYLVKLLSIVIYENLRINTLKKLGGIIINTATMSGN